MCSTSPSTPNKQGRCLGRALLGHLLELAMRHEFDHAAYLCGEMTLVLFGSAINNFGVQEILDALVDYAPGPQSRATLTRQVEPTEEKFSGFVSKIQANMDPQHRNVVPGVGQPQPFHAGAAQSFVISLLSTWLLGCQATSIPFCLIFNHSLEPIKGVIMHSTRSENEPA